MEEVLHIMQAAYGFSMHNEACRRRTNNKARAVIRYIWRDACAALLPGVSYREGVRIRKCVGDLANDLAIRRESQFFAELTAQLQIARQRASYRELLLWSWLLRRD